MISGTTTKSEIKAFWEINPLFLGEVALDPFSREFLLAHEEVYRNDVFAGMGFPASFFPFPPGARVLDVGCGPGIWTRELARRGYAASAIDLTRTAVAIARRSLELASLEADLVEGDAENLPFKDESFDGVVCHGVIYHTPNTAKCVREMARVLRAGGFAVVSVYYRTLILRSNLLSRLAAIALGRWVKLPGRGREDLLRSGDADEIVRLYDGSANPFGRAFTRAQLKTIFEETGLRVTHLERYYFPRRAFGPLAAALSVIHPLLARRLGLMLAIVAQKEH